MIKTIEVAQDIGYKYSSEYKSLIFWPNQESCLINNGDNVKYKEKLLQLYSTSGNEQKVQLGQMSPQMIQNAITLTNQIIFEVTEKCNLSCAYCGLGDTYDGNSEERFQNMEWSTAKTVLDFYIEKWKKERPNKLKRTFYIGFYGGEPLLNMPLVKKIVSYLEEQGGDLNFTYTMTTNGTLLEKHIEYLVEKKFILFVSIDGGREMNSYRVYSSGREVFDDLFNNLKKVQKEYPDFFEKKIEIQSVAHNRNTDEGIRSFFNKEFGKRPMIIPLKSTSVHDYDRWNSMRRINEEIKIEDRNNEYWGEFLNLFSGNFYKYYRSLLDNSDSLAKVPTGTCIPFTFRVFITARKDIIPCERISYRHKIGKVTDEGLDVDSYSLSGFYNSMYDKFRGQCETCYKKESCDVCFLADEQYFEEKFTCEDFYPVSRLKECLTESVKVLRKRAIDFNSIK